MEDINKALFSEHSGYVADGLDLLGYGRRAASTIGAISLDLFSDTNGEHIGRLSQSGAIPG